LRKVNFFRFVRIVPVEKSFFYFRELNLNNKSFSLSKDLLVLNFPEIVKPNLPHMFFTKRDQSISIWIYKSNHLLSLPEGYVLAKSLDDGIYLLESDGVSKILIIKDFQVINEYHKDSFSDNELNLISYNTNLNLFRYTQKQYEELVESAKKQITLFDVLLSLKSRLDFDKFDKSVFYKMSIIMLVSTVIISLYITFKKHNLNKTYSAISQQYKTVKHKYIEQNIKKDQIDTLNDILTNIHSVVTKKDTICTYVAIIKYLSKDDILSNIKITNNYFKFNINTKNAINLVEKLENDKRFYGVRILKHSSNNTSISGNIYEQ
jgi:hypothetical protein